MAGDGTGRGRRRREAGGRGEEEGKGKETSGLCYGIDWLAVRAWLVVRAQPRAGWGKEGRQQQKQAGAPGSRGGWAGARVGGRGGRLGGGEESGVR